MSLPSIGGYDCIPVVSMLPVPIVFPYLSSISTSPPVTILPVLLLSALLSLLHFLLKSIIFREVVDSYCLFYVFFEFIVMCYIATFIFKI